MLSSKMVRVKHSRNKLLPQYIEVDDRQWQDVAERLVMLFRSFQGASRDEVEEEVTETLGDNPTQFVHQGLAKLLEDRCEFEVQSDSPPDEIREKVFLATATMRRANAISGAKTFDRESILNAVAAEMSLAPDVIEKSLFADLKGEQRLMQFQDCTAEQLLHRYNVALAQAILLRSTGVSILITGESAQRFRQLFRAIKFHRLICEISSSGKDSYLLKLDGPLSLFSSTQKYGLQLAFFLPTVLQCHHFELTANVRWGTERKEKLFTLNQGQGLRSHLPDYGSYIPPDVKLFAESFRKSQPEWELQEEASIVSVGDGFWTPDFKLIHLQSKKFLFLELFGFWRRTDVDKHYQRLRASGKVPFLLAVGEQFNIDENPEESWGSEIYRFKRTPLPGEVVRLAAKLLDC